jgi:hypothetical protein
VIVGAAVCPGAPFLIDGVADAIATRLDEVRGACLRALALLPESDVVLLISSGKQAPPKPAPLASARGASAQGGSSARVAAIPPIPPAAGSGSWRVLSPGTVIASTAFRRSDLPGSAGIALSSGPTGRGADLSAIPGSNANGWPGPTGEEPAVGTIVGAYLLAAASIRTAVTVVEIVGDPAAAAAMLAGQTSSTERVGLLVIADGSASHGDDAPGRRDDRAKPFDAALASALHDGDPGELSRACADRSLALDLRANVDPLAVLGSLTVGNPPRTADLIYSAAPLGVGYLIASWRWVDG